MTVWKCTECGHTVNEPLPPEICPSCKKKCEFVDASCYTPDCGGPQSGNINPDIAAEHKK